jgi:hypothetical protein
LQVGRQAQLSGSNPPAEDTPLMLCSPTTCPFTQGPPALSPSTHNSAAAFPPHRCANQQQLHTAYRAPPAASHSPQRSR